jgi:NAD(P)-dependent dehydrogenase (short-subunit alcohol dehydrogenase family)
MSRILPWDSCIAGQFSVNSQITGSLTNPPKSIGVQWHTIVLAPFEQFSEQEFHRQFNTNVLGMFLMIEAAFRPSERKAAA